MNEPMCKLISIERLRFSKSKYSEVIIRCDDELMGRNSVIPWISDKIIISITQKNKIKGCFFVGNFECISGMQKKTLFF